MDRPHTPIWLRAVYSAALVLPIFPAALVGGTGWVGLMTGGGILRSFGSTTVLVLLGLFVFRAYQVFRYSQTLDAYAAGRVATAARTLAISAMIIGASCGIGLFFVRSITQFVLRGPGEAGIGFFVVSSVLYLGTHMGWLGCFAFEAVRISGKRLARRESPSRNRMQDGLVLLAAIAGALVLPHVFTAMRPEPCGAGNLAACISRTDGTVRRMITLDPGDAVSLESALDEIEMRRMSGSRVVWKLTESPAASLRASGFVTTAGPDAKAHVKVEAAQSPEGITVTTIVSDGREETARFVTRFDPASRIESTPGGKQRLVADVPGHAKPGTRTMTEVARGPYVFDQMFLLFRQAIGTKVHVKEAGAAVRLNPRLVKHGDAPQPPVPVKFPEFGARIDARCRDSVVAQLGKQRSTAPGDLGAPLFDVTFRRASVAPPHAHVSWLDQIVCPGDSVWIVSYWARRPMIQLRRYTSEGTLQRFVEGEIPPWKGAGFDDIDVSSLADDGNRIIVRRLIVDLQGSATKYNAEDIYEFRF